MFVEILTSNDFCFWTLIAVQSAMIIWFVEAGSAASAGTTLVSVFISLSLFPGQLKHFGLLRDQSTSLGTLLLENSWPIVLGLGCYVLIGLLWATFRWWLHVNEAREVYVDQKRQWLQPRTLLASATLWDDRAEFACDAALRTQYRHWANACRAAATTGGGRLPQELVPVWRNFVENGYRY